MIPIYVPIIGGVAVVGVGLRAMAVAKAKKALLAKPPTVVPPAPPVPPPQGPLVAPAPPAVIAALPPIVTNPDGSDHTPGTPFIFDTNADAASAVAEANRLGITVHELLLRKSGQLPPASSAVGQQAIVTTNDPAPSGDLIIRSAPSVGSPQIGGAEKSSIVTIINGNASPDGIFAEISWAGGPRLPPARGFSKKQFLKLV